MYRWGSHSHVSTIGFMIVTHHVPQTKNEGWEKGIRTSP
jgi:hypothetical protein